MKKTKNYISYTKTQKCKKNHIPTSINGDLLWKNLVNKNIKNWKFEIVINFSSDFIKFSKYKLAKNK